MAAGGPNCGVALWDVAACKVKETWDFHALSVCFTPDSKTLIASNDSVIKSWNLATKQAQEIKLAQPLWPQRQVFSCDGRWLAGGVKTNETHEKTIIAVWDVASGKRVAAWGHEGFKEFGGEEITALAFSPNGTKLLTVAAKTWNDGDDSHSQSEIRLWDMTKVAK